MKQHITTADLKTLSENQKITLNSAWLPSKYDLVVASVCIDAENDVYEDVEFVVGEVILKKGTSIVLKRLRLLDDAAVENDKSSCETEFSEEEPFDDEDFPMDTDPGDYFLKENCMPLFNIGQLISLLRNTKAGQNGFSISIPPMNDKLEQGFTLDDRFGEVSQSQELTDLLFEMLKELI